MKYFCIMLASLLLFSCRPVHVTKQYYDEYVNPTATIDYEDIGSVDIPSAFLDDYYTVDSLLVRLLDQLDLGGELPDSSWVEAQKSGQPWIKFMAVLDSDLLFVSGDEYLGYDESIRSLLAQQEKRDRRIMLVHDERCLLVHGNQLGPDLFRTSVAEIDISLILSEAISSNMILAVDAMLLSHADKTASFTPLLEKLTRSSKYSGCARVDGRPLYWIRSMAADNLVYLYQE